MFVKPLVSRHSPGQPPKASDLRDANLLGADLLLAKLRGAQA